MSLPTGKLINDATGESYELDEVSALGRSPDSVVVIPDPRVSRRHAMIRRQNDGFWFLDLGSINGSYINGRRVTTSQRLLQGDHLRIADHNFRFAGDGTGYTEGFHESHSDVTIVDMKSVDAILLVSDIRDFTVLSEKLRPDELAPIIGSWYEHTERILDTHGANLDKFSGDSVLAYWLEKTKTPEVRLAALRTAQAMHEACVEVSEQHRATLEREEVEFVSGTAMHLGPTAYGAFSSQEFTLIGDAVNVVFRLETLTRQLGEQVLVSGDFFEGWEEGKSYCRSLGSHSVKGRKKKIEVYGLDELP